MKLEVHERIALQTLLPKEGDYAALKQYRQAREMFAFTPEEMAFYELKTVFGPDGKPSTNWSMEKASQQVKDCPVTEFIMDVVRNSLSEMNRKKKLTENYLSLYEKFVVMYT